jgi:hypothetical protein
MSTLADFSLNNYQIKNYFNGSNAYVPESELLYLHSHPLIQPNFMTEIEALINRTAQVLVARKTTGGPVDRLTRLAQDLGRELPDLTSANAAKVLATLRDVYQLCTALIGKR